ncbi:hypothetical protein EYC84_005768 [Monilinia fructicola]|uniref:Uncharacterized protein n=1 Tax=Monilinia fructicola TaxID=38448 RepID=A0A5M9JYG8_MONFR|nr:hypothetical protein EYC84_005768 [Monilinia fructicola]
MPYRAIPQLKINNFPLRSLLRPPVPKIALWPSSLNSLFCPPSPLLVYHLPTSPTAYRYITIRSARGCLLSHYPPPKRTCPIP